MRQSKILRSLSSTAALRQNIFGRLMLARSSTLTNYPKPATKLFSSTTSSNNKNIYTVQIPTKISEIIYDKASEYLRPSVKRKILSHESLTRIAKQRTRHRFKRKPYTS